eukprot:snap_masked-scaffold_30-processed-gene-3.87-mRNA-1 protein AED:1.00 eAED:1.00 QI:0/0/0/0/1/1/2/0/65
MGLCQKKANSEDSIAQNANASIIEKCGTINIPIAISNVSTVLELVKLKDLKIDILLGIGAAKVQV